jgi:hypothetical protein
MQDVKKLSAAELEAELQARNVVRDEITAEIRVITREQADRVAAAASQAFVEKLTPEQRAALKAAL